MKYRKSRYGVFPMQYGWRYQVVAPNGAQVSGGGDTKEETLRLARAQARFQDKLERDRIDGVKIKRGTKVVERGTDTCTTCGKPHDCVITTRRGRRWGITWAAPDGHVYMRRKHEEV